MAKKGRRLNHEGSISYDSTNDRWLAQISLPNGKRKTKSSKSQQVVRDWLIAQRKALQDNLYLTDDKITVEAYLARYMRDTAAHNLRPTTYYAYSGLIKNHIVPEIGHIRLSALRPDQVNELYSKKLKQGLSKRTVEYMHAILHKAFKQAHRWGLVYQNVTDLVDAPKPEKQAPRIWNPDQVRRFLTAVEDHQWYPIYVLAFYCGMRIGEIIGIHASSVDLDKGTIQVRHQIVYVPGTGMVVTQPKTDKARRSVTVPAFALEVLKSHLESLNGQDGLIFTTRTGKPISARNIIRHFKEVIKREGLPDIRFHDIRHTHASYLLAEGVHPKVVQERLGHSQISVTMDIYSHVIPGMQEEAADKIQAIFKDRSDANMMQIDEKLHHKR